jgi:ribokinase
MAVSNAGRLRIAVIGHVEHVTIARVPALPRPGEIAHLDDAFVIAGGGGGIAFHQLAKSDAELHVFTAFGNDDAAAAVEASVSATGAHVHAAKRDQPHTRDIALVTPGGERTILVVGEPLHPRFDDAVPWDVLRACDAAYFTAQDPDVLRAARDARILVVTARRSQAYAASGVRADVIVGSVRDPREASTLSDYDVPPGALVMTDRATGGSIETVDGTVRFAPVSVEEPIAGSYGAGDSFAGALVWYLASGLAIAEACARASAHGAAVLRGIDPIATQAPLG